MPESLSLAELTQYRDLIDQGGVEGARQVYDSLYARGYNYAGWAGGVASGDSIAGQAALNFMQSTALMGIDGQATQSLTPLQIDAIRVDMALGYVGTLLAIANSSGGFVSRDVRLDETTAFHEVAFENHGLSLANWTLTTPMELIARTEGQQAAEDLWARVRDTGGDGPDALMTNMGLAQRMGLLAFSADPSISGPAQQWMDLTPGVGNVSQWALTLGVTWDMLNEATAITVTDGDLQTRYYLNGMQVETSTHPLPSGEYGAIRVGSEFVSYSIMISVPNGMGGGTVQYIGKTGTVTTIDGRVTSYEAIQTNGDQTTREFESDGRTTVIEADRAGDNDYTTRTTAYDAQGREDWRIDAMDDGGRIWTDQDQNNERSNRIWQNRVDAQGREDWRVETMDDGARHWTDFDQTGQRSDSIWQNRVDALGREDWRNVFFDDGSKEWTDFDQSNERSDSMTVVRLDAQGREDWANVSLDNGRRHWHDYDQDADQNWSKVTSEFDAWGREDFANVFFDDGQRDHYNYDQDGSQGWNKIISKIDAWGREDFTNVFFDDGQRDQYDYDQDGSQGWSKVISKFDAWGRENYANMYFDDGQRDQYDHDQDGQHNWSKVVSRFDGWGREDHATIFMDDGGRGWIDYDQSNARSDRIWTNHVDAWGREDWANILLDDGRRDVIDYDQDGSQAWSRVNFSYDANGQRDFSNRFLDDGSRVSMDYDYIIPGNNYLLVYDAVGGIIFQAEQNNSNGELSVISGEWNSNYGVGLGVTGVNAPPVYLGFHFGIYDPSIDGYDPGDPDAYVWLGPLTPSYD